MSLSDEYNGIIEAVQKPMVEETAAVIASSAAVLPQRRQP
jgi:hypothetical protein